MGGEPVGERQNRPCQLSLISALRMDFQGLRVTSDDGLILVLNRNAIAEGQHVQRGFPNISR